VDSTENAGVIFNHGYKTGNLGQKMTDLEIYVLFSLSLSLTVQRNGEARWLMENLDLTLDFATG
jgi:hypothetical protein